MSIAAVALIGAILPLGPARLAPAQSAQAQTQKKAKDKGEDDLFNAANKETNAAKKIAILNEWKEKYPESDYKLDRLNMLMPAYFAVQQWSNVINAGKEALALDANDIAALYWIAFTTPNLNNAPADVLATAEKAANGLLAAARPATMKEENWPGAKRNFDVAAHRTLGWVAMKRQSSPTAEQEFMKALKLDPSQVQVSYWLGDVILGERKPERNSEGIYDIARAAAYDGPNAYPPQGRSTINDYLAKVYSQWHGDNSGLEELKAAAKANAFAPAGFHILSAAEVSAQRASLAPAYVSAQDAASRLQLKASDGSFSLAENGQQFNGTYSVNGKVLRLHIVQLQRDVDIAIDGNRLIVNGSEIWNAAPNASQPVSSGAAPSNPQPQPAQQTQPDQASDGVWVGFYGTCQKNDLVIFKPTVYANQVELARLACNTYFYVAARPGTYKFCATKNKCTTAAIGSNGPYYFRVLPTAISYSIGQIDPSVAEDELQRHRMTALDLGRVLAPKLVTMRTDNPPSAFLSPQ
jgi:hypothetical protein